jgi:GYF domain 2
MTVREAGSEANSTGAAASEGQAPGQGDSIAWYVGRDGKQYGPVGDPEFWAMLASGQVLPTDLVWRDGFPEWKPALELQPPTKQIATKPVPPVAASQASETRPHVQPQSQSAATAGAYSAPHPAAYADAQPNSQTAPAPKGAVERSARAPSHTDRAHGSTTEEPLPRKRKQRTTAPEHTPRNRLRSIGRGLAWTAIVLFFVATLGAAYLMVAGDKSLMRSVSAYIPQFGERVAASPPLSGFAPSSDATDNMLQLTTLGRVLKKYHPDWYAERVKEASDAVRGNKSDADVAAGFMLSVVKLRREYAGDATSAPIARMKSIATLFAANLVRLKAHSVDACFQYVSSGESAPVVVALLQSPEHTSALQAQLVATFEGIDEGRKTPRVYPQPKASDYDVLVAALEARGWKKDELTLFADSQKLAKATPETVCRLVTEWFEAQIGIKDADVQLRLLADSLRPIVAG